MWSSQHSSELLAATWHRPNGDNDGGANDDDECITGGSGWNTQQPEGTV